MIDLLYVLVYLFFICLVIYLVVGFLSIPIKLNRIIELLENQRKSRQSSDS